MLAKQSDRSSSPDSTSSTAPAGPRQLVQNLIRDKENRAELFGCDLSGHSAWDIILALYSAGLDDCKIRVSLVGKASGIPQTTSLRYLVMLEANGLVARIPSRRHNSFFIVLTDKASAAMNSYLVGRSAGYRQAGP